MLFLTDIRLPKAGLGLNSVPNTFYTAAILDP